MSRTFQSLLNVDDVYVDVAAGSKKHALQLLSQKLAESTPEVPADDVFDGLIERERWGCTATDGGVAVPHARMPGAQRAAAVLLRLAQPIDFDSPEDEQVDILFGFIVPDEANDEDTEDLRVLTQRMLDQSLVASLREASDGAAIYAELQRDDGMAARDHAQRLSLQEG